ncbi:MAG: glycerophosphodiester phosphodiesterase family protein [Acidimicrobiales bacterium]
MRQRLRGGSFGLPLRRLPGACAQVPHRFRGVTVTDRRFVQRAHQAGIQVHVRTIDEPREMHELLDLGVDGIMTSRPTVLRDVLLDRGAWFGPEARLDPWGSLRHGRGPSCGPSCAQRCAFGA